jgi:hypothetical protein
MEPFVGVHSCKTLGLSYLEQQNPSYIGLFNITCMQVKSHLKHLLGLEELSFYSSEGMGGDHPFHSYLFFCVWHSIFVLLWLLSEFNYLLPLYFILQHKTITVTFITIA